MRVVCSVTLAGSRRSSSSATFKQSLNPRFTSGASINAEFTNVNASLNVKGDVSKVNQVLSTYCAELQLSTINEMIR